MPEKMLKVVLLGLLVVNLIFLPQAGRTQSKSSEPYRLGATMITSGADAEYDTKYPIRATLDAVEEINAQGGIKGRPLKLIIEDTRGDPSVSAMVTKKLISVDKVQAILTINTNNTLAQLPIVEQNKVLLVCPGCKTPNLAERSRWVARVTADGDETGRELAKEALRRKIKSVVILHEQQEGILSQIRGFEEVFEKGGGKVLGKESFRKGDPDLRAQITKLQGKGAEAFDVHDTAVRGKALAFKQMAELGWKPKYLFCNFPLETTEFLEMAGKVTEGVFYVTNYIDPEYAKQWERRHGYSTESNCAAYYDATKLLARAFEQADTPEGIRDVLYNTKNFKGAQGITSFNGNGQGIVSYMTKEYRGGEFVMVK